MSQPAHRRGTALPALRWVARGLALAAAYFVVAKIGLRYATIGPSISPVWPPTGLAVGALVLLGPGHWPAILLGALLANATTTIPVLAAAGIACGNAAEATVAAYLLRRRAGQHLALDDLRGVRTLACADSRGDGRRRLARAGGRSLRPADCAEHRHRAHAVHRHTRRRGIVPEPCHGPSRAGGARAAGGRRASRGRD